MNGSTPISLPQYKRDQLIERLQHWLHKDTFTLLEAAELCGVLINTSLSCRWGPITFFALQNEFRRILGARYHAVSGYFRRIGKHQALEKELPAALAKRVTPLLAREQARFMYNSKASCKLTPAIVCELRWLHDYLSNPSNAWSIAIGHVVPRTPSFTIAGDASLLAGGAITHDLEFWFDIHWSSETRRRIKLPPSDPNYVHINALEYVVQLLQLVAVVALLEEGLPQYLIDKLPGRVVPPLPILLTHTDNKTSRRWYSRVTSRSLSGQNLVKLEGVLLQRTDLGIQCDWIPVVHNSEPDTISRPDPSLSSTHWYQQMFQLMPKLQSYRYFRPSPELLSAIQSRLYTAQWLAPPDLPKKLGRFEVGVSTTLSSAIL